MKSQVFKVVAQKSNSLLTPEVAVGEVECVIDSKAKTIVCHPGDLQQLMANLMAHFRERTPPKMQEEYAAAIKRIEALTLEARDANREKAAAVAKVAGLRRERNAAIRRADKTLDLALVRAGMRVPATPPGYWNDGDELEFDDD